MLKPIDLHHRKILLLVICLAAVLMLNINLGLPSPELNWMDLVGETSSLALALVLVGFTLSSRPPGPTTSWLFTGLLLFSCAAFQDVLDEFYVAPQGYVYADVIESLVIPVALVMLCVGFYYWQKEQQALNHQLRKRERYHREHSAIDHTTGLYTALYMNKQIERELTLSQHTDKPLALLLVDIRQFDLFNRSFGELEGDRLLRQVADLLVMNLGELDLVCRYSADRFIILLPERNREAAQILRTELLDALSSQAFKPKGRSVRYPLEYRIASTCLVASKSALTEQRQQALEQLNQRLVSEPQVNRSLNGEAA